MSGAQQKAETEPERQPPPEGFSQFLAKVLDQLSLSAWLPASLFVGATALLLEIQRQPEVDPIRAAKDLTAQPVGVLIVVVFAVVVGTLLTQAFELSAIRWLEGYWPGLISRFGITGTCVRHQQRRKHRALERAKTLRIRAFRAAREALLDGEEDYQVINYWKRVVHEEDAEDMPDEVKDAAREVTWEDDAPADLLRAVEAAERATIGYPEDQRLMPTRLGNVMRAGEDALTHLDDRPLRTYVVRNWSLIPAELRALHDQYRTRLDLYCTLVLVCTVLAFGGCAVMLLGSSVSHRIAAVVNLVFFLTSAAVCYRAAITSADGYVTALSSTDDIVGASSHSTAPDPD